MKKALSLFLALIMVVGIIPTATIGIFAEDTTTRQGSTSGETETESGDDTSTESTIPEGAVAIGTADELLAIDGTESGKYYYLTKDIDLGTAEGAVDGVLTFNDRKIILNKSTFDGNGNSITGFRLESNSDTATNLSLFRATDGTSCTIKNLTLGSDLKKIEVDMVNAGTSYAVVMADIPGGTTQTFENVTVYTTMTGDTETTATDRRGGAIIGRVYGTVNLTDCETYGSITDTQVSANGSGFGGFIGLIPADSRVTITDCTNNVAINAQRMAGGFIGQSCTAYLTMSGCVNNGDITLTAALAGGIMGQFYSATATANANSITNCTNNGDVSGTSAIGGVAGEWNSKAKANKGTLTITGFNQSGAVKATGGDAGGIIGKFMAYDDLIVNDLKSDDTGSVEATGYAGGIFGYASDVPSAGVTVTVSGGSSANSVTSTGNHAGGVVGYAAVIVTYNIINYTNKGTVTTTAASKNAGGLFGQIKTVKPLTVCNFTNTGAIVSKNNGAAIIGQFESPSSTAAFIGCTNTATITAQSGSAAMIVGWGSGTVEVTVENCVNSGAMTGAARAGGFFGGMTSGKLTVANIKNFGTITGNGNHAGGFAGDYTVNSGTASFDGFANYATVTSNGGSSNAGGLIGQATFKDTTTISNLSNYAQIKSEKNVGAAFGFFSVAASKKLTINDLLNTAALAVNNSGRSAAVFGSGSGSNGTDGATVTSVEINRVINFGDMTAEFGMAVLCSASLSKVSSLLIIV